MAGVLSRAPRPLLFPKVKNRSSVLAGEQGGPEGRRADALSIQQTKSGTRSKQGGPKGRRADALSIQQEKRDEQQARRPKGPTSRRYLYTAAEKRDEKQSNASKAAQRADEPTLSPYSKRRAGRGVVGCKARGAARPQAGPCAPSRIESRLATQQPAAHRPADANKKREPPGWVGDSLRARVVSRGGYASERAATRHPFDTL